MASGDSSFPFDNGTANEPEFRRLFEQFGDGIVEDLTGSSFAVSVNTATQEVTVGPGRARCAAAMLLATMNQVFRLGSEGVQPAAGQVRRDRIVVRTDYSGNVVERALKTGAVNQPAPALTQSPTGVQELALYQLVRTATATGTTISIIDERSWLGRRVEVREGQPLPLLELGSTVRRGQVTYHRQIVSGVPDYVPVDDFDADEYDRFRALLGNIEGLRGDFPTLERRLAVRSPAGAVYASFDGTGGSWTTSPTRLHIVTVPDPGWPYRLQVSGQIRIGSPTVGTIWDVHMRASGGGQDEYRIGIAAQPDGDAGTNLLRYDFPLDDHVHTGASTVALWVVRSSGTGNGQHDTRNRELRIARWRA